MFPRLTPRGWCFVIAAAVFTVVAAMAAIPALLYPAGLLFMLTFSSAMLISWRSVPSHIARTADPIVLDAGQPCQVRISAPNQTRRTPLQWRDRMSAGLIANPSGAWRLGDATVTYHVTSTKRGDHQLGPLTIVATDPAGLARRGVTTGGTTDLTVLAARIPLPTIEFGTRAESTPAQAVARQAGAEADDVIVRHYRAGDPMKRMNWKATARSGELMVRQAEHHDNRRATVLIDLSLERRNLEWAVSAASSVAAHLRGAGFEVTVSSSDRTIDVVVADGHSQLKDALIALARCTTSQAPVTARTDELMTVLVAGDLDSDRTGAWLQACRRAPTVLALVAATTGDPNRDAMRGAGWTVASYQPDSDLAALWRSFDVRRRNVA